VARLFVAAWPAPHIVELIAALPRAEIPGLRWTGPEQWHVTLRFFGEADVDDALDACRGIDAAACEVTIGPQVERLGRGVVTAPVHGLVAVADAVTAATAAVGRPPDDRPFRGHITLARTKGATRCPLVGHALSGTWPVRELGLVRSELLPNGARYTTVEVVPLR
jgi:2'-5' RNA ligase